MAKRRTKEQIKNSPFNVTLHQYLQTSDTITRNRLMRVLLPMINRIAYGINQSFKINNGLMREEVEGIVLDTFFRQLDKIQVANTPDRYFYIIAKNRVVDHLRHHNLSVNIKQSTLQYYRISYDTNGAPHVRSKSVTAYAEEEVTFTGVAVGAYQ